MNLHPERFQIFNRLQTRLIELSSEFAGSVYRFVEPKYTSVDDMFAGRGPLYANGRWLAKGEQLATYTSLTPEVALAEALAANRYYGFSDTQSAPLVFVTAQVTLKRVIDLRDGVTRQRLRISETTITQLDWRQLNLRGTQAVTQAFGHAFHASGVEGFLCQSAALNGGENLIVFPENLGAGASLQILSEVNWPAI